LARTWNRRFRIMKCVAKSLAMIRGNAIDRGTVTTKWAHAARSVVTAGFLLLPTCRSGQAFVLL
jgi:hypothetical protein